MVCCLEACRIVPSEYSESIQQQQQRNPCHQEKLSGAKITVLMQVASTQVCQVVHWLHQVDLTTQHLLSSTRPNNTSLSINKPSFDLGASGK
jgi:hypothetical protein